MHAKHRSKRGALLAPSALPAPKHANGSESSNPQGSSPSFIDLFCGGGGFTLGMLRAGFRCVAAIDFDPRAVETLRQNLPQVSHVLERDLTVYQPAELAVIVGMDRVDIIVGGPPCQGFSTARQVDGSNHGRRFKHDPRRLLYLDFLRFVEFFRPSAFVMENVLGLRSAAGGDYLTRVQRDARALGYKVHGQIEDAWDLGVPQKRRRQLIIGTRAGMPSFIKRALAPSPRATPRLPLGIALGDLPALRAGAGADSCEYDLKRRAKHLRSAGHAARKYLAEVLEVDRAATLTNHVARPHSDRDLRDFRRLKEGESSAVAMRVRGVEFEHPYDKENFKDRYTRQSRSGPCSTIVAHLAKDGLMFIHPTQTRSLTPREAARVQSFPDWFRFPKQRTHSFRLIGNAVPPLVAEAIGGAIAEYLNTPSASSRHVHSHIWARFHIRLGSQEDALQDMEYLGSLDQEALRRMPSPEFLAHWQVLLATFPELHPENALDHGREVQPWPKGTRVPKDSMLFQRECYARSGWPVALELVGKEAWRRHSAGQLLLEDLYDSAGTASVTDQSRTRRPISHRC